MNSFYVVVSLIMLMTTVWSLSKLTYRNISIPWVKSVIGAIVGANLVELAKFIHDSEEAMT